MKQNLKVMVKSIMILFVLICFCTACGGKHDDPVKVYEDLIEIMEDYAKNLQKADNAKDVASAMNDVAEKFEKIAPRMDKLQEKYPDLNDMPESLQFKKDIVKVCTEIVEFQHILLKYKENPDVKAAINRAGSAMLSAGL